jgi:hypothetical protein
MGRRCRAVVDVMAGQRGSGALTYVRLANRPASELAGRTVLLGRAPLYFYYFFMGNADIIPVKDQNMAQVDIILSLYKATKWCCEDLQSNYISFTREGSITNRA